MTTASPKISVITPSIREKGVDVVKETLSNQSFKDFEHIVRLSEPGPVPDLCRSLNSAVKESKGELLVFVQDYIRLQPDALQRAWDRYKEDPEVGWTAPVGKVDEWSDKPRWEWRKDRENGSYVAWFEWETDFAWIPKSAIIDVGGWDEDFDSGFSWDNVEIAYRLFHLGWGFRVDTENLAVAWDHDKHTTHPYRHKPNKDLWIGKKREIENGRIVLNHLS